MSGKGKYVTINHTDIFNGLCGLKTGEALTLRKDHDNQYDDEAILAYRKHNVKCGYVANSVGSVARGTLSAGRLYDRFDETLECSVRFIIDDSIIAEVESEEERNNEEL